MSELEDMNRKRKWEADNNALQVKILIEQQRKNIANFLVTHRELVNKKRLEINNAIAENNRLIGSSLRLSIPMIDAMIMGVASVPFTAGLDILGRPQFTEMVLLLNALKIVLKEEMDAKLPDILDKK